MTLPQSSKVSAKIDPATRLGHVHLTVANLDRQITFYTQALGFKLHWREGTDAALGTEAEVLLRLTEDQTARRYEHTTGMYHFAVLYPNRKELARALARLFAMRYPHSPTDHGVSMTTYLDDLEGNNIELYIRTLDRATFEMKDGQFFVRYSDGSIGSGRDPLDVEALFSELTEGERLDVTLPEGTRLGHMHLYASSLEKSMAFYRDVLGFEEGPLIEGFRMGEVGLETSQPHVIAFNTWKGEGAPPSPPDALGIRYFTVVLTSSSEFEEVADRIQSAGLAIEQAPDGLLVRDPSNIGVLLTQHMKLT